MSTIINKGNRANDTLRLVDNLDDYKVHHDDVDIRGYTVMLPDGERIGEVEGLLADVSAKLVRYVEIEIEDDVIERHTAGRYSADDREILIPIGLIQIDKDNNTVVLHGINIAHMVDYPRFNRKNGYSFDYEIDTNNYLADFHEYGDTYQRTRFDSPEFRSACTYDPEFYNSRFYTKG